jgi:hypothetical protein
MRRAARGLDASSIERGPFSITSLSVRPKSKYWTISAGKRVATSSGDARFSIIR